MWILKISKFFGACLNLHRSLREPKSFKPIIQLMKKVDNQVKRDVFYVKGLGKNHCVKLSTAQLLKDFDKSLVPSDSSLCCPYCENKGTLNFLEGHEKV